MKVAAEIRISPATPADLPAIAVLLREGELPHDDLAPHIANFLVARSGGRVVGAVGAAFALFFLWPYLSAVFALQNQFKDNLAATDANTKSLASAWDRISQIDQSQKAGDLRASGIPEGMRLGEG